MELKGGNMKRKTTGILISCVVSICCMVVLSMSSHTHDVYASYSRYVTANNVVVRKKASNKGKIVGSYKKAANITTDTYTRKQQRFAATRRKDLIRRSNMEDIIDISQQDICQRRNQLLDHTRKQRI